MSKLKKTERYLERVVKKSTFRSGLQRSLPPSPFLLFSELQEAQAKYAKEKMKVSLTVGKSFAARRVFF